MPRFELTVTLPVVVLADDATTAQSLATSAVRDYLLEKGYGVRVGGELPIVGVTPLEENDG